ncbi:MAG: hypothetical protein ACFFF4_16390 [Candidatus Thorarchaeota archaeon]
MLSETTSNQKVEIEDPIVEAIEKYKMSSIAMIASQLDMEEESVIDRIQELLSTGLLNGSLSEDQARFYRTDIVVSKAPIIRSNDQTVELEKPDTRAGKYAAYAGLASIIGGFVIRGLAGLEVSLSNMGASMILLGIIVLASGWLYVSRKQVSIA